jgi:hydrogenase nickel incorporation protein HypA/HybF
MHELSLVSALLAIVDAYAGQHHFKKVTRLHLSMGALSCVDRRSLQFAFEVQSQGGPAEGAQLAIDVLPAVTACLACGSDTQHERFESVCPQCGSHQVVLTAGTEELRLIDFDAE